MTTEFLRKSEVDYTKTWLGSFEEGHWYVKKKKEGLFLCGPKGFRFGPLETTKAVDAPEKKCVVLSATDAKIMGFAYSTLYKPDKDKKVKKGIKELRKLSRGTFVATLQRIIDEDRDKRNLAEYNKKAKGKNPVTPKVSEADEELVLVLPWTVYIQWDGVIATFKEGRDAVVVADDKDKLTTLVSYFFAKPTDSTPKPRAMQRNMKKWNGVFPNNFLAKGGPFSFMIDQVSNAKKLISEIKLIKPGNRIIFTKCEVHTLMSFFFLGFFAKQKDTKMSRVSEFNAGAWVFSTLVQRQLVVALTHYFNQYKNVSDFKDDDKDVIIRWLQLIPKEDATGTPPNVQKSCVFDEPDWENSNQQLCDLQVDLEGGLEDVDGSSKICFADPTPGGTILSSSGLHWTQEELMMGIFPEVLMMLAIIPHIDDTQAWCVSNVNRCSDYKGYDRKFRIQKEPSKNNDLHELIGIDATVFGSKTKESLLRECNKAYLGFSSSSNDVIATGHWGGGVFKGDKTVKALVQLIAASQARKKLVYKAFRDADFKDGLDKTYKMLVDNKVTVKQLYKLVEEATGELKKASKHKDPVLCGFALIQHLITKML